MPMYDRVCIDSNCNTEQIDCWEPIEMLVDVKCTKCGKNTERAWIGKPSAIIGDDIPGGLWIRHGLCNEDGTPRKYYSKSEIAKEAARRGLVNRVEHTVDPRSGSDKNKHTTRWTSVPLTEEQRLPGWHAHEATLPIEIRLKIDA